MNQKGAAKLAAARRVNYFIEKYRAKLGAFLESPMVARLKALILEMQGNGAAQHGSVKQHIAATVSRGEKRYNLRVHHMLAISRVAGAKLTGISAQKMAEFNTPDSGVGDVALLAAARAMSLAAKQYEQVFLDEKLAEDFLAQLDQAAADLQDTLVGRDGDRMERRRAKIGIERQCRLVSETTGMMGAFMLRKFAGEPGIIGEWELATRIGQPRSHRRTPESTVDAAPGAPTPAPA